MYMAKFITFGKSCKICIQFGTYWFLFFDWFANVILFPFMHHNKSVKTKKKPLSYFSIKKHLNHA